MTIVFAVKVGNSGGVLFVCALNFEPTELYGLLSAAETLLKADEFYTANESEFTGGNNIIQQQWKTAQLSVKSK